MNARAAREPIAPRRCPSRPAAAGRLLLLAWLGAVVGFGGHRVLAADMPADNPPPVAQAVAEPDAEVNIWLTRAREAIQAGAPDQALTWLRRVLRAGPTAMASTDGVTYLPARKLALGLLRALPERTLAAYRLPAAAAGEALAGQPPPATDLAAIEAWYRNGLPGPAAAAAGLRLAGLYLDQERYREARRVLLDLLDEYPGADGSRAELLARLVVASARAGDPARAAWAWAELQKESAAPRWAALNTELRPTAPPPAPPADAWTMAYGGPTREAAAPVRAPDQAASDSWLRRWGLNLGPGLVRSGPAAAGPSVLPPKLSRSRGYAVACLTALGQRPADDVIFAGNRAWVNGFAEYVAVDLETGGASQRTAHVTDDPAQGVPWAIAGTWICGNRLNRAASLIGDRVYCVEDNYRSTLRPDVRERRERVGNQEVYRPLPCGNALAAYAADTGRLLWRRGRELAPETPAPARSPWRVNALRFVAAPVPCAGLLLTPVEDDSGLGIVGLDADRGVPVWRTRLTAKFPSGEPRAAPVTVTVAGADAYLCGGNGSVTALDGCDGTVRWTTRYEPLAAPPPAMAPASQEGTVLWGANYEPLVVASAAIPLNAEAAAAATWEESLTLVVGETVVALPEDSAEMLAFARATGARRWTQRKPAGVNYVVGRRDALLIVAGRQVVAGVDLTDGRERWRTAIAGSTGRGTLYGPEVLLPHGRRILRVRAADGLALEPARAQTMDGLPLGNLYAHGNELLVAGLERLYALTDARPVFAALAERLAREPTAAAYAERGAWYAGLERYPEAVADWRAAWKLQRGTAGEAAARAALLTALWHAAAQDPGAAEPCGAEARELAATAAERAESAWCWAQARERAGNIPGALSLYAALAAEPDTPLAPSRGETDWEVAAHRLAADRLRTLLGADAANGWARLEEPAAQALARLGPTATGAALVDVATSFPGTGAGREAARQAAELAAGRGDLGTAEAILQRALALAPPAQRAAVAEPLVRLYERMAWATGAARLRDEWPRVGDGARAPEFLDRAAAKARGLPLPPWRLRWRQRLPAQTQLYLVAAGLFYWRGEPQQTGCLDLASGRPRWQRDEVLPPMAGAPPGDDSHLILVYAGDRGACLDAWSGTVITHALFRGPAEWVRDNGGHDRHPLTLNRVGLATVRSPLALAELTGVDVLTGQVAWRRGDLDTLADWLMWQIPVASSAASLILMSYPTDGSRIAVALEPWTGAVTARRSFEPGVFETWAERASSRWGSEDPGALDRGNPVLEAGRLTVKNLRTGATLWRSPPDLAIVGHRILSGGTVLAQTAADELLLLSGEDGHPVFRSAGVSFVFDNAASVGQTVIAVRSVGNGVNEALVLDTALGRIVFQGRLPPEIAPLRSCGAALPERFLASVNGTDGQGLQVLNSRGENTNGWRLPRREDLPTTPGGGFAPRFADGLILMCGPNEVLAYEHDPDDGGRQP